MKTPVFYTKRTILRPMTEDDASTIVRWRNDPENLQYMEDQKKITVESHLNWFENRPPNRLDYLAVAKTDGSAIGTINLTFKKNKRAVSGRLFGNHEFRQQGYAFEVTKQWFDFAFNKKGIDIIEAKTKINNIPNINFNFKLGYIITNISYKDSGIYYQMELLKQNFFKDE